MEREYVEIPGNTPTPQAEAASEQVKAEETTETPVVQAEITETEEAKAGDEAGKETESEGEEKPHRKTGSQRARERADRAEQALAETRAELERLKAPTLRQNVDEPQLADFETVGEWQTALREHVSTKAREEAQASFKAEESKRQFEQRQNAWREADQKFAQVKPDYDDALEDLRDVVSESAPKNPQTFQALDAALSESDLAPQLKYYLGKNPDEFKRLNAMTPVKAVMELARIEDRLTNDKPPEKKTTNAPAPIKPLTGTGNGSIATARHDSYQEIR